MNGKRTTVPSYRVRKGDVVSVREGSRRSPLFSGLLENKAENTRSIPAWLTVDLSLLQAEVVGEPTYNTVETGLDYATVFEFYSR